MSALGEYVHYHRKNYDKFGIARRRMRPIPFESTNTPDEKISKLSSISLSTIQEMKKRMMENSDLNEEKEMAEVDKRAKERVDTIYEMLAQTSSKNALNSYFYAGSEGQKAKYWLPQNKNLKAGGNKVTAARKDALKKVNKKLDEINGQMVTEADLKEILDLYNIVTGSSRTSTKAIQSKSARAALQEELNDYSFNTIEQHVAGKFGESLVASIGDTAYNLAGKELVTAIKEATQSATTMTQFGIEKNALPSYLDTDENGSLYKISSTYDKVDAEIVVNGEQVEASVKNYRTLQPVHLQTLNLIHTLIELNKSGFGTHWMNMHALGIKNDEADKAVTKEIAYEALVSGNPLKRGVTAANTFIYMNRSLGTVEIYNTRELLEKLDMIDISPSIGDILLKNNWKESGPEERIADLINQIHQTKIKVTFNPKSFQK